MDHTTIPIVTIDGKYLYAGPDRFIARGIVYQPCHKSVQGVRPFYHFDPLHDDRYDDLQCDIQVLRELNINAIWVNHYDLKNSHTKCMRALAEHGIYVIFGTYNLPRKLRYEKILDESYFEQHSHLIDAVARYRNTLGVSVAGQAVSDINICSPSDVMETWKAVALTIREMKRFMRFKNNDTGQRILPLCISDGQWSSLNSTTFEYLTEPDAEDRPAGGRVDFYCFSHFDTAFDPCFYSSRPTVPMNMNDRATIPKTFIEPVGSTPVPSGETAQMSWEKQLPLSKFMEAKDPVPILLAQYGSNLKRSTRFRETRSLYGTNMNSPLLETLSGGFAYEFEEESNGYGLVVRNSSGTLERLAEYTRFRNAMSDAVGQGRVNNVSILVGDSGVHTEA